MTDKNHMWIDNSPTNSYEGNLYVAWTDFGGTDDAEIKINRSTNDGLNWSTPLNISSAINAGSHNQGVNISGDQMVKFMWHGLFMMDGQPMKQPLDLQNQQMVGYPIPLPPVSNQI